MNLFGFERLKLKIRRLKLWKLGVPAPAAAARRAAPDGRPGRGDDDRSNKHTIMMVVTMIIIMIIMILMFIVLIQLLLLLIMIIIIIMMIMIMIRLMIHPVSITRFSLRRFSPGAGLLRNPLVHR